MNKYKYYPYPSMVKLKSCQDCPSYRVKYIATPVNFIRVMICTISRYITLGMIWRALDDGEFPEFCKLQEEKDDIYY